MVGGPVVGPAFLSVAGGWSLFDQSYERHFIPGTTGSVFASTGAAALASSNDDAYFVQGRAGWAATAHAFSGGVSVRF